MPVAFISKISPAAFVDVCDYFLQETLIPVHMCHSNSLALGVR